MPLNHHRGGAGEPLVLIHGLAAQWRAWGRVIPALERRFDVLALDLPGFGESAPDGTGPSIEEQADRVERFFAEEGIEHPHVAGFSMGGGIALELARRGAVRSATAFAPVGFWTDRECAWCRRSLGAAVAMISLAPAAMSALAGTRAGRTMLLSQTFARPWRMTAQEARETLRGAASPPGFQACSAAFATHRFRDGGELRDVPLTIAWGDRDRLLLHRQAARARRMLPFAEHVTLHGCGHVPFTDDPELCIQTILAATARAHDTVVA